MILSLLNYYYYINAALHNQYTNLKFMDYLQNTPPPRTLPLWTEREK